MRELVLLRRCSKQGIITLLAEAHAVFHSLRCSIGRICPARWRGWNPTLRSLVPYWDFERGFANCIGHRPNQENANAAVQSNRSFEGQRKCLFRQTSSRDRRREGDAIHLLIPALVLRNVDRAQRRHTPKISR